MSKLPLFKSNWTVQAGLQARQGLARIPAAEQPQALFFHTQVTATLAQNWIKRIPSVVSLDATPLQYDRLGEFYAHDSGPAWLEQTKWRLNRDCFRAARHLVTWSAWAKEGLVAEYEVPAEKVTVIPPGVNVQEWLAPPHKEAARTTADTPTKILFVGGNLERKGGLVLLEAFRALRAEFPSVELHLVTKDTLPDEPGITLYHHMQPNSPELKALYHAADLFCLPTFGDCLPMVLSEASAAGLPVISTQVAAIPELVHHGKTGYLVPTGDPRALKEALYEMVSRPDKRRAFGQKAITIVQNGFDAQHNAQQLLNLLKEVAHGKQPTPVH